MARRQTGRRWRALSPPLADVTVATALTVAALVAARATPAGWGWDAAATLSLAWRRRAPEAMAAAMAVALAAHDILGSAQATLPGIAALLLAIYSVGAHARSLRTSLVSGAVLTVGANADLILQGVGVDAFWPFRFLFLGGAWAVGWLSGRQRRAVAAMAVRAQELSRRQEERAACAVAAERARVARELHDVVAHCVSVMVVQAGAAEQVLRNDPDAASEALRQIQTTGRQSVLELRRLLGILRDPDRQPAVGPPPSLARLEELVVPIRQAGVPVTVAVDGIARPVPVSVDVSAYRIVQEALTNVVKHAGPATATVRLHHRADAVELEITDTGNGAPAISGEGHGLVGIRERVALFGGTTEAGNLPGGGFRLYAVLPLDGQPS